MKKFKVFAVISAVLMSIFFVSQSHSLDQAQEEEYAKARMLLSESKVEEARTIFAKLSKDDTSNLKIQLGTIDADIEETRIMKAAKNTAWKSKIYQPFGQLKRIYPANATSPDIFVSFAKCYWINNRFQKAEKSLRKALYYKPDYSVALI